MSRIALIDRVCKKCKVGTEFHKGAFYCKACCNEKSRVWHSKRSNLDKRNKAVNTRMRARKQELVNRFGGKCTDCGGEFSAVVYDFHHTDPTEKDFNPSYIFKMNPQRAEEELKKCVMLCSNCHRIRHYG
jgi:hypothetical protein